MKNENVSKKIKIRTYFIIWVLISSMASLIIFGIIFCILNSNSNMVELIENNPIITLIILVVTLLIISGILTIVIANPVIRLMGEIEDTVNEVSNGNYKARLRETKALKDIKSKFNKMILELDSVEILRSDFINNFSHELKTPLVSIKGYAEELKRDDLNNEEKEKYLNIIIEESNRLTSLSTNILNLSKIEKQEILTDKKKVNIGEQIRKVILVEYKKIEKKNIELDLNINDCYSMINEDLFEQVWINLIENAIKYNKQNGKIIISIEEKNNNIVCSIKNEGKGIKKDQINHIFDKFYTTNKKSGNGLGLALVKKIIDLHQCNIEVKSTENKETEFIITLNSV